MSKKAVLLIDIDDTILPTFRSWLDVDIDDSNINTNFWDKAIFKPLELLKINCGILRELCKQHDLDIVIISSWSSGSIDYTDGKLNYTNGDVKLSLDKNFYKYEHEGYKIIKEYLEDHIVKTDGRKELVIKEYIKNKNYDKVIVLDDSDFKHTCNPNNGSKYIYVCGLITTRNVYEILDFIGVRLWEK